MRGRRSSWPCRLEDHITEVDNIPLLSLPLLFVNVAPRITQGALEASINEADKKDLINVERLRHEIETLRGRPGVAALRRVIDFQQARMQTVEGSPSP